MGKRTIFAGIIVTAAAITLTGCGHTSARPATTDELRMEEPAAAITPTETPEAEAVERIIELTELASEEEPLEGPEETVTPTPSSRAQESSPPITNEPIPSPVTRSTETKSAAVETATPAPSPSASAKPEQTGKPMETQAPEPTFTPATTQTAKPTATPAATATPRPIAAPSPTATPKPASTPRPTAMPALTPTPTSTPKPTPSPSPTPTPHVHDWTMHEAVVHYETRVTGTKEVAVGTYWEEIGGWDESRPAYYRCNDCGATFSSDLSASDHIISANHSSYSYFPAETVHHDGEWVERTKYETQDIVEGVWVTDQEAYWTCSCGETRDTQP